MMKIIGGFEVLIRSLAIYIKFTKLKNNRDSK